MYYRYTIAYRCIIGTYYRYILSILEVYYRYIIGTWILILMKIERAEVNRGEAALRSQDGHTQVSKKSSCSIFIDIYMDLQRFVMLFDSIFGGVAPPNPILFSTEL